MNKAEQQPVPERRSATELPITYPGVCDEVFFDLVMRPRVFLEETGAALRDENPALAKLVVSDILLSSQPSVNRDWALAYYAILSRSARISGVQMPVVSEDLRDARLSEHGHQVEAVKKPEDLPDFYEKLVEARDGLIAKEAKLSDELRMFWVAYYSFKTRKAIRGVTNPLEMEDMFNALHDIQWLLHQQIELNRFSTEFSPAQN